MRARVAGVLGAAGFLALVTNRIPALPALGFLLAALVALQRPDPLALRVAGVWAYWVASFLSTGESLALLVSPDFHRRDGQIFFSTLPLLAFAWSRPSRLQIEKVLGTFFAVQAGIASLSVGCDLLGRRRWLDGILFLYDENPHVANYCGLYQAHNAVGSVQALGVLISATLAVFSVGSRGRWFWGSLAIPLLWGMILSGSRGSWLALLLGMAVLGFIAIRRRVLSPQLILGAASVLILTGAVLGPRVLYRLGDFADPTGTHAGRWEWWKRGLREWSWSPIVGEGMGRYNDEDRVWTGVKHLVFIVTKATVVNNAFHAHNSYVHFLAEGGAVGLAMTVGLWGWMAWRLRKSREPLKIAAFLGVIYLGVVSFTEHYMGGGAMLLVLSSIVGAAWHLPEPATEVGVTAAAGSSRASVSPVLSPSLR